MQGYKAGIQISMQSKNYETMRVIHACLTHFIVQTAALHAALPTVVPGVLSLCPSLPAPLSSRCEASDLFHPHSSAIYLPVATYMLSHLIYPCQSHSWQQDLHIGMFQTPSIGHPADGLGLWAHLYEQWKVTMHCNRQGEFHSHWPRLILNQLNLV